MSLRPRLGVMRDLQPAAINPFVHASNEVIDLSRGTVLQFYVAGLNTHLPGQVSVDLNALFADRRLPLGERLVVLEPILFLRLQSDHHGLTAWTDEGDVRL